MLCLIVTLTAPIWPVQTSFGNEVRSVSPAELEDRNLIHHLLKDQYYVYAREEAHAYLEKYPQGVFRAEVIFVLAEIAVVDQANTEALAHYETILQKYPDSKLHEDALYLSGSLHLQLEENKKGRIKLRRLIQQYPQSPFLFRAYYRLGELAFKEKYWESAATYLKAALENGDLNPAQQLSAKQYLAWTFYFQGNVDKARTMFLPLLDSTLSTGDKAKIAYQFAADAQEQGHYRKAIAWHERLLEKWPDPAFVDKSRFWIAECLFLLHQDPENQLTAAEKSKAVDLYSQNLALADPVEKENSHYHRGWFLLELGRQDAAERDFSWLQQNNVTYGKNVELTIIRARYHESRSDWREANRIYSRTLALQTENSVKNQLLSEMIRNHYRLKECRSVIEDYEKTDKSIALPSANEIHFYAGTCYHRAGEMHRAAYAFTRIEMASPYAPLCLDDYMDALKATEQLAVAIQYLSRAIDQDHFKDKERILLYKTEYHLDLQEWHRAFLTMKALEVLTPHKKTDPWFMLNVARTLDQIVASMKSKQWRAERPALKTAKHYHRQAIIYYREAYKYMPLNERAIRLSILNILIEHHETYKAWNTLIHQYQTAIDLSRDEEQIAQYTFRLASIKLKTGQPSDSVIPLLQKLHGKADREVNYKASALLAELYIAKKNFTDAIETLIDLAQQPIDETPWFTKVHFRLGELYQSQEKWLSAIRHYSKVAKANQDKTQAEEARKRLNRIKDFVAKLQAAEKAKEEKQANE